MVLNKNQKIVCWVALGIIVVMGLFPPWVCGTHNTPTDKPIGSGLFTESAGGYHFIFVPPSQSYSYSTDTTYIEVYRLDYGRLFLQWLLMVAVSGGLIFLFREPQKTS